MKLRDIPVSDLVRISRRAERIVPLTRRQPSEQSAHPTDIHGCDSLYQLPLQSVKLEPYVAVLESFDEPMPFESFEIIAARPVEASFAERRAQIAYHVPSLRSFASRRQLVHDVVLISEVCAVEHHHQNQQAPIGLCGHEGILLPRPGRL